MEASRRVWMAVTKSSITTVVAALFANIAFAAAPYWRIDADRLTVISSGTAASCERLAIRFAAFAAALREFSALDPGVPLPVLTVVSIDQNDARFFNKETEN